MTRRNKSETMDRLKFYWNGRWETLTWEHTLSAVVKMVSMFPIDSMHVSCLEVTSKLLNMWLKRQKSGNSTSFSNCCSHFRQTAQSVPAWLVNLTSNQRRYLRVRSMESYWAAIFHAIFGTWLPSDMYDNLMLFSFSMYLLLSPDISDKTLNFA